MMSIVIHPLKVRHRTFNNCHWKYYTAAREAVIFDTIKKSQPIRIETYTTTDIRRMVEESWGWPCSLRNLPNADWERVHAIMEKLKVGKPRWPYVSNRATAMRFLIRTEVLNGRSWAASHGDGWHRIIAAVEMKLPTMEVMFFEKLF